MKINPPLKLVLFAALLLALAFSGLSFALPVRAQDSTGSGTGVVLETLRIDIWPEYDKPSVLVIYHMTLSDQTSLPASMSIRIPAAVGEPHAVAIQEPNGLFNLSYEIKKSGVWEDITFITTVADVRIEYYDPTLTKDGGARSYTYTWAGGYTVNNLSLLVQQPGGAAGMQIKPDMGSGSQADDGLTYYSYLAGKVDAGTSFDVKIAYTKDSDELTSPGTFQSAQPSQPVDDTTAGRVTMGQWLPFALGGGGVALITIGVLWYLRAGRSSQPATARRRHGRRDEPDEPAAESVFCHQCGKKSSPGDAFCRSCGTKLR